MMKRLGEFLFGARLAVMGVVLFGFSASVQAQSYCVRAGATGAGNGSDWNNAYTTLPATLQRGATYYVADGNYSGRIFNTANSGTTLITIKKATVADHGSGTGWQDSYGDGQALFSGESKFMSSYWVIDGQTGGGPGNWKTGFGFKFHTPVVGSASVFQFGDWSTPVSNITLRHLDVQGNGDDGLGDLNAGVNFYPSAANITVSYGYFHDFGCVVFCALSSQNLLFEYIYTGKYESVEAEHAEIAKAEQCSNLTWRYCVFTHSEGTGGLILPNTDGVSIYGCVFYQDNHAGAWIAPNGVIGSWTSYYMRNVNVYNNSFINITTETVFYGGNSPSGNVAKNNLFYNTPNIGGGFTTSNNSSVTTDPFVDYRNLNFALKAATVAGDTSISSLFRTDMFGVVGSTIGAVQFGGSGSLTVNAGLDLQVTLPNSANLLGSYLNPLGGLVTLGWSKVSGPGTVSFGSASAATTSATFSSAGTYVLRLTATVLLVSVSDDVTVTVLATADTTPPTVSGTAPAAGSVVSNTVTLSATASDNAGGSGVASVTFLVDGAVVGSDSSSPYSISWVSSAIPNGSHVIQARATDVAGNQTISGSVSVTVQNAAPTLTTGLVGYWMFNEAAGTTAADSSGNGNNATVMNGASWVAGQSAGGLSLDGTDDSVRVPTSPSLELPGNALTVSVWVKVAANGQWQAIARKVLQDGTHEFPFSAYDLIIEDAGTPLPRMAVSRADGTRGVVYGSTALNYGQWYHLAGVYNGVELKIYVNGSQAGSAPFTGALLQTGQPLLIGRNGIGGDMLKGSVDDLRVYDRALSPAEVQTLAAPSNSPTPPGNLRLATN